MKKFALNSLIVVLYCLSSCSDNKSIGIQPYGSIEKEFTDSILAALHRTFNCAVLLLETRDLPEEAYTTFKSPRYKANLLLEDLKLHKSSDFGYILGLTAQDICITKKGKDGNTKVPVSKYTDFGIFGLGKCPGDVSVISLYRLRNVDRKTCIERLQKIAIHELGHNYGLKHCKNLSCVMEDAAESISTIDRVNTGFCSECLMRIQ